MSISTNQQQYQRISNPCYDLSKLRGTGNTGFADEVTGHLVRLEIRSGFYEVKDKDGKAVIDPRTGRPMIRPNSWTAVFDNGSLWSWPTRYVDPVAAVANPDAAEVEPWLGFDESIDIMHEEIHVYREPGRNGGKFPRLERVKHTTTVQHAAVQQLTAANAQPVAAPWEYAQ